MTTPTLSELEARYAEAKKASDNGKYDFHYFSEDIEKERLAASALIAALRSAAERNEAIAVNTDLSLSNALERIDALESALRDLKSFISNYGQDAFPPFKLGDPDTYALKLIHEALTPIRESIRREPHA